VAGRRGANGDRVGHRIAAGSGQMRERFAVPGGARGEEEREPLRARLQPPLHRSGERDREFVRIVEADPVLARDRAMGGGEQSRIGAGGAMIAEVFQPEPK
jgi:hypothetical protein